MQIDKTTIRKQLRNRDGERGSVLLVAVLCILALFALTIAASRIRVSSARDIEDRTNQSIQYWNARSAASLIQASLMTDIAPAFDADLQRAQVAANGYPLPAFDQPNVPANSSVPVLNTDGSISTTPARQSTSLLGNLDAWALRKQSIAESYAAAHGYGSDKARVAFLREYQRQQMIGVGNSEPAYVLQYMIDAGVGTQGNVRGRVRPSGTIMLGPAQPTCNTTVALAANPTSIPLFGSSVLTITYTNANHVWLVDQTGAIVPGTDTTGLTETNSTQTLNFTVSPIDDMSYRAFAQGSGSCQALSAVVTLAVTYPPPVIVAFDASPTCINRGDVVTLSFTTQFASTITITGGGVNQSFTGNGTGTTSGSMTVTPTVDTTYTITATGKGGTASRTVSVTVKQPITIDSFISDSYCLTAPASSVNLTWAVSNAETVTITDNATEIPVGVSSSGGTRSFPVNGPTSFTITANRAGCDGTPDVVTQTININTNDVPTATFTANPNAIQIGSTTLLQWSTTNTTNNSLISISASPAAGSGMPSPQTVTPNGTLSVQPTAINPSGYTYTLTVTNAGCNTQTITKTTLVTVSSTPVPPSCPNVQSFDGDSCIVNGNNATLRWNVANADFVDISGPGVSRTFSTNPVGTGSFTVAPTSDTTYTLTARTGSTGPQPVTWQGIFGVTASSNNLTKNAAAGWDAGASSAQAIIAGDGYVEVTASETTTYRMFGLSNGDTNQVYTDIDFALYTAAGGELYVYEGGNNRGYFGQYATGDVLRVAVEGGVVKYKRNGQLLYTSTLSPTYPLLVDTSLYSPSATLNNAIISGNIQTTSTPSTTGLAAYWNLDEASGTNAADSSGNGHIAYLLNGTTWTTGKVGSSALNFDGANNQLAVNIDDAGLQNTFSYSFWAYPTATHEIDSQSTSGYAGSDGQRFVVSPSWFEAGDVDSAISVGTNGVSVYENGDSDFAPLLVYNAAISGWTQITVVWENKQPRLYINGTLVKTGLTSRQSTVHMVPNYIGGGFYGYYAGALDDFRVYNRALSSTEVQTLSGNTSTGSTSCTPASPPAPTFASFTVHVGQRPTVSNLVATPGAIDVGQTSHLSWANSGNTTVRVIGSGGDTNTYNVPSSQGYLDVRPAATSTYTVVATSNDCAAQTASQTVTITVSPCPSITSPFRASSTQIYLGQSTTLQWGLANATQALINGSPVPTSGSLVVSPVVPSTYTLTAVSANGSCSFTQSVTVNVLPLPAVLAFDGTPSCIYRGESTTLSYTVQYASTVTLTGGGLNQSVPANEAGTTSGSLTVSPSVDTTYTLTASSNGGTASRNVFVTVKQPITVNTFVSDNYCLTAPANTVNLTWTASSAETATITDNATEVVTDVNPSGGTRSFTVTGPTSFTLTVSRTGCDGTPDVATRTIDINSTGVPTAALTANPSTIQIGKTSLLQWSTTNTDQNSVVTISASPAAGSGLPSPQTVTPNGTLSVQPTVANSYTYTLNVQNNGCSTQTTSTTTTLLVTTTPTPPACPNVQNFDGDSCIAAGNNATLHWNVANADFVDISAPGLSRTFSANPVGTGSLTVSPLVDTTYTLTARTNGTGPQPVTWQGIFGVTAATNNLTKNAADGWDAGASSAQAIISGDGYVEFTASETTTYRMLGLGNGDSNQSYVDIEYAFYPAAGGELYVYESGVYRGDFGPYSPGDLLRVAIEGGVVKYKRNGTIVYTSTVAPTYPLLVDTSLYSNGATLRNVVISGNIQTTSTPPTNGLIAYWNFDEASGTTAADSSGNGHTGYLYSGTTWTAGKVGSAAINFDGSSNLLGVNVDDADLHNTFSYSFWANPTLTHTIDTESTSGYAGFLNTHRYLVDPSWYEAGEVGAGISVATNGITIIENGDNDMAPVLVYNAPISGWTQVTVVYQNKQPKLYLNGTLVRTGLTSRNSVVHFTPGYLGGGFYGYYGGTLDDFRVYNRALSTTEIQTLSGNTDIGAQACTPASPPNPTTATFTVHVGQRPTVSNLAASPGAIDAGQTSRLTWANSANVSVAVIGSGGDPNTYTVPPAQGYLDVRPSSTTTYTVVATSNDCAHQTASQAVTVTVSPCPSITSAFSASPASIYPGQSSTLQWGIANASQVLLNGSPVAPSSSLTVSPAASTTYTLRAVSANGSCTFDQSVTVNVLPCPSPTINSFAASPSSVTVGGITNVTLSWSVADTSGTGLTITIPGVGSWTTPTGSVTFTQPQSTTTYTLQATSGCGASSTAQTTITVNPCPSPTINSFTATPNSVTQGNAATVHLAWNVTDPSGNGISMSIPGVGTFTNPIGSIDVPQPQSTTTYTLTASPDNSLPVTWTNASGVTVNGNNLTAQGGFWNAGAISTQTISSGNGYVETTIAETNTYRMIGLGNGDSSYSYGDIEFAWYPAADGILYIYESGNGVNSFGPYATGDVLRVAAEGGAIKYLKNGQVLYTSTHAPAYPLLVDTSFYTPGSTLNNVRISSGGSCGAPTSAQTTVTVTPCPPPTISSFSASPNPVTIGSNATVRLSWSVFDSSGTGLTITMPGIGTWTTGTGFVDISQPQSTTTYQLIATAGCGGQSSTTTTVTANPCPTPTINAFSASPNAVTIGGHATVRLSWSVSDPSGTGLTISIPGIGTWTTPNGFVDIAQPQSTTTYTLQASAGCGGQSSTTTTVTANPCPPPIINSFTVTPGTVFAGNNNTVRLSWSVSDPSGAGVTVSIAGIGTFGPGGFVDIAQPQTTTTYTLTATAGCGTQANAQTTVVVNPCPAPVINSFVSSPNAVTIGGNQTVRLSWNISDASGSGMTVTIQGIGTWTSASGFVDIAQPQSTTTYNLIARAGCGAQSSASTTVTASNCPAPQINSFTSSPASVLIGGGQNIRLSWNVADSSGYGVSVTISNVGGTFGPSGSVDIAQPQSTTTYTLTATNGCGASASAQVTVIANPPSATTSSIDLPFFATTSAGPLFTNPNDPVVKRFPGTYTFNASGGFPASASIQWGSYPIAIVDDCYGTQTFVAADGPWVVQFIAADGSTVLDSFTFDRPPYDGASLAWTGSSALGQSAAYIKFYAPYYTNRYQLDRGGSGECELVIDHYHIGHFRGYLNLSTGVYSNGPFLPDED